MGDGTVGIRRPAQIAITVRDQARARAFYRDVLELRHLFDAPPKMSFFDCGGVRLLLGEPEGQSRPGEETHGTSIVYFDVADIGKAHSVLESRAVTFEAAPHKIADIGDRELWMAFFRDSEGNVMALMSEQPRA
jgi:predicted enzyme related to lactoylglutathione lyase